MFFKGGGRWGTYSHKIIFRIIIRIIIIKAQLSLLVLHLVGPLRPDGWFPERPSAVRVQCGTLAGGVQRIHGDEHQDGRLHLGAVAVHRAPDAC